MNAARQFEQDARRIAVDVPLHQVLKKNLATYQHAAGLGRERFADWNAARAQAHAVKAEAIAHLDRYLLEFERNLTARGGRVFWAETAAEARDYILALAQRHQVRQVVKSKSMVSEEVHLTPALEAAGIATLETDLGEYIVQLRNEPPFHIVTPAMHLRREHVAALFHEKLGLPESVHEPEALVAAARAEMRRRFLAAEMGITGANFLIADAGLVAVTENEGNARLSAALPRIHVVLTGIEKILPRLRDLALFWPLLATAGTGQAVTCYNSLIGGPRQENESDGPEEMHVVLLDNGRGELAADPEQRDILHCIRCGACLNICPIFETVGGHGYGTTYQGPIGAVLTPHLRGPRFAHLAQASSLCGACTSVCPVEIDLHPHLLQIRRDSSRRRPWREQAAFRAFGWLAGDGRRFEKLGRRGRRWLRYAQSLAAPSSRLDPLRPWTRYRAAPELPPESFRDWWRKRKNPAATSDAGAKAAHS